MEEIKDSSRWWYRSDLSLLFGLALLKVVLPLPLLTRYGYHHDELYFIACGQHLSFGYVDHAPLVPWIAWLATTLFGQSLFFLRILSTLSGAAAVLFTGLLVKRVGGGRFAQVTACAAMIIAPVYLRANNMLCLPGFEPLFWVLGSYLLVRIVQENNPRLWLPLGVVLGLGLLNKHSMLFFAFGMVVGLLFTPLRKHFKSPWFYAGGAAALLLLVPNLVWQADNGWPTVHFLINLKSGVMSGISLLQFLAGQLLYLHPLNAVLWIAGLSFFLFTKAGKPYRVLGWLWLAVFLLLVITKSKIYYLSPAYPPLLAGGAIALERWVIRKARAWLKPVSLAVLILGGAAFMPIALPIFNIDTTESYIHGMTFGAFKNIYEVTKDLRGMFGWQKKVEAAANAYHRLPAEERQRCVILAAGYGNAGAVDYFGKDYNLPNAVSLSMTYWLWGLPDQPIDTVIGMGYQKETMEKIFDQVELAAAVELENVNPWEKPFPITICRQPKVPLSELWKRNRPW